MNPFIYFFVFLLIFFYVFPLLINFTPKRLSSYWQRKQKCKSCPKFVDFLLAASMAVFNMLYFACYPHCLGLMGSSLLMFCMMNRKFALRVLNDLRNNQKLMCGFTVILLCLTLTSCTFPVAVVMGLMLDFACLMPKREQNQETSSVTSSSEVTDKSDASDSAGIQALNDFFESLFEDAEVISTEPETDKGDNTTQSDQSSSVDDKESSDEAQIELNKINDEAKVDKANVEAEVDKVNDEAEATCEPKEIIQKEHADTPNEIGLHAESSYKEGKVPTLRVYEPVHQSRPNRHSNGSNYKKASKNSVGRSPMKHASSKLSTKFNKNKSQRRHG